MNPRSSVPNWVLLVAITLCMALTACSTLAESQVRDIVAITDTTQPLLSPTPTIIWFPPSATPLPRVPPTVQPTPEEKPGVGSAVLTDDFSSAADWNTASSDQATIDVSNNHLTIAVQPGIYGFSLRQKVNFNDFYAEITAQPSLCRGGDEYGFLFRAPNNLGYYRFALSCDGTAHVDRWSVGKPHVLHPPALSGDAPLGAPGEVRLGVWAVGSQIHFFLNGNYQFSVTDKNYLAGSLGVFAVSTGTTPVTVSFSHLVVYDVSYSPPTTTPMP